MNRPTIIVDTRPRVAFLTEEDQYHRWAAGQLSRIASPALTCDVVLVRAFHLLTQTFGGVEGLLDLMQRNAFISDFRLLEHSEHLAHLITKYANVPTSLADAYIVLMVEQVADARVLTTNADFQIYRQHDRREIPVIMAAGM